MISGSLTPAHVYYGQHAQVPRPVVNYTSGAPYSSTTRPAVHFAPPTHAIVTAAPAIAPPAMSPPTPCMSPPTPCMSSPMPQSVRSPGVAAPLWSSGAKYQGAAVRAVSPPAAAPVRAQVVRFAGGGSREVLRPEGTANRTQIVRFAGGGSREVLYPEGGESREASRVINTPTASPGYPTYQARPNLRSPTTNTRRLSSEPDVVHVAKPRCSPTGSPQSTSAPRKTVVSAKRTEFANAQMPKYFFSVIDDMKQKGQWSAKPRPRGRTESRMSVWQKRDSTEVESIWD